MPKMDINFAAKSDLTSDQTSVSKDNCYIANGYSIPSQNSVEKRPGISEGLTLGAGPTVSGLFWWAQKQKAVAVNFKFLYIISNLAGSLSATNLTTSSLIDGYSRPTFALADISGTTNLFVATGGRIGYTDGTTAFQYIADADCPTKVSHIAAIDGYLLAAESNSNRWWRSVVGDPTNWVATDYLTGSGDPDYIQALHVRSREVYIFGKKSVEIWENTGGSVAPFERVSGGFIESGAIAPYSIVSLDNNFVWLDDKRRVVQFNGRTVESISSSNAFDKKIQELSDVSDCYAESLDINGQSFLIFHFPVGNKTYVYNRKADDWHIWDKWNPANAIPDRWMINCSLFCPDWGIYLGGSIYGGLLYKISASSYTDNGAPIRFEILTGNKDHDALREKRSDELRFRVRRGDISSSSPAQMHVRWRDNNRSSWSNGRFISLGASGETDIIRRIQRSGTYRTRQWSFMTSDAVPVAISAGEEDITILR